MKRFMVPFAIITATFMFGCYANTSNNDNHVISKTNDKADKPNVILFIADDMYPNMFNNLPQGKGKNLTPNIDRLASQGAYLSNMHVASPVCTPSRYNVLTGNYASRATNDEFVEYTAKNEGQTVIQWQSFITPGVERTLGHYMQELGYKTGFVGKNHVVESAYRVDENTKPNIHADPTDLTVKADLLARHDDLQERIKKSGFDFADNLYDNNPRWLGIKRLAYQNMDWITEAGLRFIDSSKEKPFFLYFATTIPHGPTDDEHSWQADPRITPKGILETAPNVQPSRDTLRPRLKAAGLDGTKRENVLWLDDALGALFEKLEQSNQIDNTIIFFFNDHGQNSKGTLYQGGVKSQAFVWRSKGFACGKVCDMPVSNTDFLPTILEMAGNTETKSLADGVSFAKALDGESYIKRESMYFELGFVRGVIKGDYKYMAIRYPQWAESLDEQGRKQLLDEYNSFRSSFGAKTISTDHTLPFGHLELTPGGGGAGSKTYGQKSGYFDSDQLYDLSNDPVEEVNLATQPEYQAKLKEMQTELQKYVDSLPGKFDI